MNNESKMIIDHTARLMAIVELLIEKNVITGPEFLDRMNSHKVPMLEEVEKQQREAKDIWRLLLG